MTQKILMIQPGAFGDIFICAPIARWYSDAGYEVVWPIREQFYEHVVRLGYVTPHLLDDRVLDVDWLRSDVMKCLELYRTLNCFDYVLNLADRGPHGVAQLLTENFEQVKYRLADVPFSEKHNLKWIRHLDKEEELFDRFVTSDPSKQRKYAFVHNTTSAGDMIKLPRIELPIVYCEEVPGYTIFDWYQVIKNADEIYVTESSIHSFCDGIIYDLTTETYLLSRPTGNFTISHYWNKALILS